MFIEYARVSTADQNSDHQIDALLRAGVAERDINKASIGQRPAREATSQGRAA